MGSTARLATETLTWVLMVTRSKCLMRPCALRATSNTEAVLVATPEPAAAQHGDALRAAAELAVGVVDHHQVAEDLFVVAVAALRLLDDELLFVGEYLERPHRGLQYGLGVSLRVLAYRREVAPRAVRSRGVFRIEAVAFTLGGFAGTLQVVALPAERHVGSTARASRDDRSDTSSRIHSSGSWINDVMRLSSSRA